MPDLPDQPRAPLRGRDLAPEGNPAAGESARTEAGSDRPRGGGNGAMPKEQNDVDMDETIAGTAAPEEGTTAREAATDASTRNGDAIEVAGSVERPQATGPSRATEPGEGDEAGGGDGAAPDGEQPAKRRRRPLRTAVEWLVVIGGALLVALLIRSFLLQAFWIPTASMEPTLQEGDRVLVNKVSYDLHDVHRGDIIVFERPEAAVSREHPEDDIKDLIKRVVGLPGETIEGHDGAVYVDGRRLEEPYLPDGTTTSDFRPLHIREGEVFVMGDNRGNSTDSRVFGPVDEDLIVGRAFVRIYPLGDIGGL